MLVPFPATVSVVHQDRLHYSQVKRKLNRFQVVCVTILKNKVASFCMLFQKDSKCHDFGSLLGLKKS